MSDFNKTRKCSVADGCMDGEGGKRLRLACLADAADVLAVYEPYIKNSFATFEDQTPGLEKFARRMANIMERYPYLVYVANGKVAGYAYAAEYRTRPAYRWDVEISVYLAAGHTGQHAGSVLATTLVEILRLMNIQNIYTCVALPNSVSQAVHDRLGFCLLGIHPKSGCKFGQWIDLAWYGLGIGRFETNPTEPLNFAQLPQAEVQRILTRALPALDR